MLTYIRLFALISCILVIGFACLVGHEFREIAAQDLFATVNGNNLSLARGFANTSWKTCHEKMKTSQFSPCVSQYFEGIAVTGVRIYAPDGKLLVSTAEQYTAPTEAVGVSQQDSTLDKALRGEASGIVLEGQRIVRPDKNITYGTIIKTCLPLPGAVIEINYDATPQWQKLSVLQESITIGIVSFFVVLFVFLWLITSRAETILAQKK